MTEREALTAGLYTLLHTVSPQAVDKLLQYAALLREKNKVMNLTAVTDPLEIVSRHLLDCAALVPFVRAGDCLIDIGTGAGLPGIPLAALCPDTSVLLLDAQKKRIDFLHEIIRTVGLPNCTIVHARAEEFAQEHRETFDLAVCRAVAALPILCELSLPLLKIGGSLLAMKASDCAAEAGQAGHAIRVLGGGAAQVSRYTVPLSDVERAIVHVRKEQETPVLYPRRYKKIISQPL